MMGYKAVVGGESLESVKQKMFSFVLQLLL